MVDHALESRINRDFHYKFHFVRKIDSRSKEARRRERRKESERREQVYTGQYYRAIPSEMPRLGLLGMSHCKQWTMRLLLLHNGRSLTRSRPYVASSPPPLTTIFADLTNITSGVVINSLRFLPRSAKYRIALKINNDRGIHRR